MEEPIDNLYFDWLCANVRLDKTAIYLELFRIMHSHPFVIVVSQDENRVEDARELREHFLIENGVEDPEWLQEDCSVLEVLIAFSERAAFQIDLSSQEWFWQFITNLKLEDFRRASHSDRRIIHDILDRFIMRDYEPNGDGGLFPLRRPRRDQRKVEIWYQFCDYVEDSGLLYELL